MSISEIIALQQKGHENEPRFMIGEQLKEIAEREPICAELLERDLQIKEMSLEAAEKQLQQYADEHRAGKKCFCITPKVAEKILRQFYGLPERDEKDAPPSADKDDSYIDLSTYM